MFHRMNKRKDKNLTNTNVVVLSLGEAVKRWTSDGQFLMTEVNPSDSYESKDNDIPMGSSSEHIGKIEAALNGMDFVKSMKATEPSPQPSPEPSLAPSPSE